MPRVSRAISALAAIAIPPLPLPQFSQPSQLGRTPYWDRYVTVMPALFKCKQSEAPALTLFSTPQLFRKAFGTSSTPLSPVFLCKSWWVYPNVRSCWWAQYQFAWFSSFRDAAFCAFRSPAVVFIEAPQPFVIDQQLFRASSRWKLTRSACQMPGKNPVRVNWKQIHSEFVPWWGDNKSWWWHNGKLCCGAFSEEKD